MLTPPPPAPAPAPAPAMPPPSGSAVATRFATYGVVDSIAGDESLDFSVLRALVDAYSEPLEGAPEATRERVALRCLQEASSMIAAGADAAATTAAGVPRVDGARSCQDVLLQLTREAGTGKFEKDLLAPFSRDIQEAICTTKLTLPIQLILAMKDLRMEGVLGAEKLKEGL